MKKWRAVMLLYIVPAVLLGSCGGEDARQPEEIAGEQSREETGGVVSEAPEDSASDALFTWELLEQDSWRDNTLDDYTAILHLPLAPQRLEDELGGIWEYALGDTCGAVYKRHLLETDSWEEWKIVTEQGEESSSRLAFREGSGDQISGIGGVVGSDRFMMLEARAEGDTDTGRRYRFFETDRDLRILRTVELEFLPGDGGEIPGRVMADKAGNIHFTTVAHSSYDREGALAETGNYYYVTDSDGTLLARYDYTGRAGWLVALYDGRVGLCTRTVDGDGAGTRSRLELADPQTGEMKTLVDLDRNAAKELLGGAYYTLWDEKTLLYADNRGLHFADLSGNPTGDAYIWGNHGISFGALEDVRIGENGEVSLIYSDSRREGNLLLLKPTWEKEEIVQVVLAVSSYMRDVYYPAVVEFNKRYPACHIALKTDYDKTRLLTELTAGKGPVLVDTMLTGFEGNEKLWASLEGLFAGEEWEDILIPQAMDMGRINETLYGVVSNFEIETVVIGEDAPTDWDYESFLSGIEEDASIEAICNLQSHAWYFMYHFLINGVEDSYFLDRENGRASFDSDRFRRALGLGMAYCDIDKYVESGMEGLEDKVFCNTVRITRPELIDLYRICYGEDANYIGYPTGDGSTHYIGSNCVLAVRKTATEEEKMIAGAFLRILLSRECQLEGVRDPNFWLSVRRDVLEEQIGQVDERSMPTVYGFDQITLGDDYDREYDARLLEELLENARPKKSFPGELNVIFAEEMEAYMEGTITEDLLIERLAGRVNLYLAEQE